MKTRGIYNNYNHDDDGDNHDDDGDDDALCNCPV
jgi:hypothetical protein